MTQHIADAMIRIYEELVALKSEENDGHQSKSDRGDEIDRLNFLYDVKTALLV